MGHPFVDWWGLVFHGECTPQLGFVSPSGGVVGWSGAAKHGLSGHFYPAQVLHFSMDDGTFSAFVLHFSAFSPHVRTCIRYFNADQDGAARGMSELRIRVFGVELHVSMSIWRHHISYVLNAVLRKVCIHSVQR